MYVFDKFVNEGVTNTEADIFSISNMRSPIRMESSLKKHDQNNPFMLNADSAEKKRNSGGNMLRQSARFGNDGDSFYNNLRDPSSGEKSNFKSSPFQDGITMPNKFIPKARLACLFISWNPFSSTKQKAEQAFDLIKTHQNKQKKMGVKLRR